MSLTRALVVGVLLSVRVLATELSVPAEFDDFEVHDVTQTMRDDFLMTMAVDPTRPDVAYVGSMEGRFYKTLDGGLTWTESTVLPEVKGLWAYPEQPVFFGRERNDGEHTSDIVNLTPHIRADNAHTSLAGARAPLHPLGTPTFATSTGIPIDPMARNRGSFGGNMFDLSKLAGDRVAQLKKQTLVGLSDFVLGAVLSSRAPRLSLLLTARGRLLPVWNRRRLLNERGFRNPWITRINPHPTDSQILFACTRSGLYRSTNGGLNWVRVFVGYTALESVVFHVAFDPSRPNRLFMSTMKGAFLSENLGDTWIKLSGIPDVLVSNMIVDPTDTSYVYAATHAGVWRSNDGAKTFSLAFFSTLPGRTMVFWMSLDPFDPNVAYIGTGDGALTTTQLRSGDSSAWIEFAITNKVGVQKIDSCRRHRGHLYAIYHPEIFSINMSMNPPASLIMESWDGGQSWRRIFSGRTGGEIIWFEIDTHDPDELWVNWSRSIHRVRRVSQETRARAQHRDLVPPPGPTMGEVVMATLKHHGVEMEDYSSMIDRLRSRSWLPARLTVTFYNWYYRPNGLVDRPFEYTEPQLEHASPVREYRVMVWAAWNLPGMIFQHGAVPMIRERMRHMNDALRFRLTHTIHRNYGELQRIEARLREAPPEDLLTRATYHLRKEQLEAVVDLASGNYLSRHRHPHEKGTQ